MEFPRWFLDLPPREVPRPRRAATSPSAALVSPVLGAAMAAMAESSANAPENFRKLNEMKTKWLKK